MQTFTNSYIKQTRTHKDYHNLLSLIIIKFIGLQMYK